MRHTYAVLPFMLVVAGCPDRDSEASGDSGINPTTSAGSGDSGTDSIGPTTSAGKFDVGGGSGTGSDCQELGNCPECEIPPHTVCDQGTGDLFQAIGLNCPGETPVMATVSGAATAMGVRTNFGGAWPPTEGTAFAVLGSGIVAELDTETPALDSTAGPTYCNDDLGAYDPGATLPAPLMTNAVAGDCSTDASQIGTGDCSKTIEGQWNQGLAANDYTEMRITAAVPTGTNSFSYDFAFFSTEYPFYYGSSFNDMYVGWLQSEGWTGNVSFDGAGNPISLNAGFLDYRDDAGTLPEFNGTCMKLHAGTKWLSTVAPVVPGEQVVIVFAVFDLSDSILDSYVLLDNFQWGCEGTDKPTTNPIG
jgi:hypothetical protein